MVSIALPSSLLVVLICLVVHGSCQKTPTVNGTTINWNDKFEEESTEGGNLQTEYDAKGLQPWYNFVNSFISTVLSKDPYDLITQAKKGTLMDNLKDDVILGYALGMVIVVGIGVLFIILMPIVGLCFCCCRCCGKCGGDMSQKDSPNNNCKRAVFAVILLMITLLMFAGVLLTFVCNDRMSDTVDGMVDTSNGIVKEAVDFINRTVGEVEKLLLVDFPFVIDQLSNDITDDGVKRLVGDPLLAVLDKVSVEPIEAVKKLSDQTQVMRDQLQVIESNSDNLSSLAVDLDTGLSNARKNLTEVIDECKKNLSASFCDQIDPSALTAEANFTNLPNVTNQLSNVQDIVNQDFEKSAEEGLQEVKDIPNKILNDTQETRSDIRKMISNASSTVTKMRNDLRKIADDDVISKLKTFRDDNVPEAKEQAQRYDKYRWIAGVVLTCMLLIIVVLMALGLMCGVCGYDAEATSTTRGRVSNMGGVSLMAAAGFCFIFASFLMLLTTICFIIGAPVQTICKSIQSGELYREVIDKPDFWGDDGYILSKTFFGEDKKNVRFTIGGFINNCRENKPLFVAGPFDQAFNISEKLNIKELLGNDTTEQFEKLKVNLSDVDILSDSTRQSLVDLEDSGVDEINFDGFLNETQKSITQVDLQAFAANVSKFADEFFNFSQATGQHNASILGNRTRDIAQDLRDLDMNIVKVMSNLSRDLDRNVNDLRSIGSNLKTRANDTLKTAEEAEDYLHTRSSDNINSIVSNFTDRVLGWGFQFTDHVKDLLKNHLGRCKPVTNIYDAAVVVVCNQALYPFNGFWFSIGYCLFFFIPAIIFCVKLAKHYRTMDYERDFDEGMDRDMYEMGYQNSVPPPAYDADKKHWANPKGYPNYR